MKVKVVRESFTEKATVKPSVRIMNWLGMQVGRVKRSMCMGQGGNEPGQKHLSRERQEPGHAETFIL